MEHKARASDGCAAVLVLSLLLIFMPVLHAIIIPENTGWNAENPVAVVGAGAAIYPSDSSAWLDGGDAGFNIYITQKRYLTYNIWGEPVATADGRNYTTTVYHSGCGPYMTVNSLFVSSRTVYDSGCRPIAVYDANMQPTNFSYDSLGRLERVVGPQDTLDSPTMRRIYHFGSAQADDNYVSTMSKIDSGAYVEKRELYDGLGRQYKTQTRSQSDGIIEQQTQFYPTIGMAQQTARPYYLSSGPDAAGWTAYTYTIDPLRQLTITDPPGSGQISVAYSSANNMHQTVTTDENGLQTTQLTDALGRLASTTDAAGGYWQFQHDAAGHLLSATPPGNGAVHTYQYDSLGRLWREHDPEKAVFNDWGNTDAYEYDSNNNGVWHYTMLGFKETAYDELNRPRIVRYDDWTDNYTHGMVPILHYYYDGDMVMPCLNGNQYSQGRLCGITFANDPVWVQGRPMGTLQTIHRFGYDSLGRTVEEAVSIRRPDGTYAQHSLSYTYTPNGNLKTETIDGAVRYTFYYDTYGRLHGINMQKWISDVGHTHNGNALDSFGPLQGIINAIAYNATGAIQSIDYANGVSSDIAYTARGWVDTINTMDTNSNSPVFQRHYAYDDGGNLQHMYEGTSANGNMLASYSYDSLYRLTGVSDSGYYGHDYGFGYDALGNRMSQTDGTGAMSYNYVVSENNKLRSVTAPETQTSFTYNEHGSLATKQVSGSPEVRYKYNLYDNTLKAVDTNGDGAYDVNFTYDEASRRLTKLGACSWSVYLYDVLGNNVQVEDMSWC